MDKTELMTKIRAEFQRWETLLNSLTEAQVQVPLAPSHWSTKDVVAHLRAWQQVSIANLEAACDNTTPVYPDWFPGVHPAAGAPTDRVNARIYDRYRDDAWSTVHEKWRSGFQHFMELGEAIPETTMFDAEKYAWMGGYDLAAVLRGSYIHHHQDHYEPLAAWWRAKGHPAGNEHA